MREITQSKLWELYIGTAKRAYEQGQQKEAEEILTTALNELSNLLDERKFVLAEVQWVLANIYRDQGRFAEAEPLYTWALSMAEATWGKNHLRVAKILEDYSSFFCE